MIQMKAMRAFGMLVALVFIASEAAATKSYMSGVRITQLRTYGSGSFGTCVAGLSVNINTSGSNQVSCTKPYLVSFDCGGNWLSKNDANAMFSTAQLAYVTNRTVSIFVDDQRTVNDEVCITELLFIDP